VSLLVESLERHGARDATLAIVLGSGLGAFAARLQDARVIPYGAIGGMPASAVPGHAGRLVLGELGGVRVLVQEGRVHLYEGWSAEEVTRAVRAFAALGVPGVVLTNAAGGLHREWPPGTFMRIRDHLNLQAETPLGPGRPLVPAIRCEPATRPARAIGPAHEESRASTPYDPDLGSALELGARETGTALENGVYAGLRGPAYETPAEIRMLAWMGADAVGMSTVLEAIAARAAGARVAAVSCITNPAAGIAPEPLSHAEVIAVGQAASRRFCDLLERSLPRIAAALRG
jgi:purine-nucleoside phosphorylase